MTKINDILNFFEEFAPLQTAMSFDNCGLLVGDKNTFVNKVLVALDITNDVVLEAEKKGCELIISHHPVIFNPIKKLSTNSPVYMLVQKNISAICMHTNLDLSEKFGVNLSLAKAIGLENIKKSPYGECLFTGEISCKNIEQLAKIVKNNLNCAGVRYNNHFGEILKVAVSSGAGGDAVFCASSDGADVLVTGEIKHHEILYANSINLGIIDAGHFKTEDVVILPLCKLLAEKFDETSFIKSSTCSDMINYL